MLLAAPPPRVTPFQPPPPFAGPHIIPDDNGVVPHPAVVAPPRPGPALIENYTGPTIGYRLRSRHRAPQLQVNLAAEANTVLAEDGSELEYRHLLKTTEKDKWITALSNDLGRLSQGVGKRIPTGNETIRWIRVSDVPAHKKVTYARLVASLRPHKTELYRVRVTVGGDRLPFFGDASTETASGTTTKLLLNSTISTPGARFLTADIKDFYYGNPLDEFKYMRMLLADIP